VVHGGEMFKDSVLIDDVVKDAIEQAFDLAPLHNPPNLKGIQAAEERLPDIPHVAVFDTAFHHSLPALRLPCTEFRTGFTAGTKSGDTDFTEPRTIL
jgi:acetate kinase